MIQDIVTQNLKRSERKGMNGLTDRSTWKDIFEKKVPECASILSRSLVFTPRKFESGNPIFKAILVKRGHLDKDRSLLLHCFTKGSRMSIELIAPIASSYSFEMMSNDAPYG